jgi:hypothetical protein
MSAQLAGKMLDGTGREGTTEILSMDNGASELEAG